MCWYAEVTRRKGILALELEASVEESPFLRTAASLVTDGTDPEVIAQILYSMFASGKYTGFALLSRLVMAEGLLAIQAGENARLIETRLVAILGEDYIAKYASAPYPYPYPMRDHFNFLQSNANKKAIPESVSFETRFLKFSAPGLRQVLREFDADVIRHALFGCGTGLINYICNNLPHRVCQQIYKGWSASPAPEKESILQAQKAISDRADLLISAGRIRERS